MSKETKSDTLAEGVLKRNQRSVARAISIVENHSAGSRELLQELFPETGKAIIIGITGSPGSGKSTLVDQLVLEWRSRGKTVAVIAVDPSSPFSGGAVLGDRIRMANAAEDEGVFIRSIATRGALGGLSKAANDVTTILDAAGFDVILVETVGVGQAEVDIVRLADTCVVVMVPGLGDSVQAIKAGVLEIADVFVVNKADRDGADLVQKDLRSMLTLVETPEGAWTPDIIRTVATKGEGRAETIDAVVKHRKWLESSGAGRERQHEIMKEAILQRVQFLAEGKVKEKQHLSKLVDDCLQRKLSPLEAAERLLDS